MLLKTRINHKKFFLISLPTTAAFLLFARGWNDIIGILVVYVATVLHLAMLAEAVFELVKSQVTDGHIQNVKDKIMYLFAGKLTILILSLLISRQIMGNRIIIPVINYVIQIFILTFSIRTKGRE
ncbi:hypothetical protein BIY24_00040 [Halobacteriovorax marinus]|uniref:Integral membrane protein n=1 Tax=Halobacteriovorax marinus (strain ATCC BAA-682 / DSM 15412 / SJ) TaxID=862908 RepID=E1X1N1_HALMS|nr:hypothetical protein [Halobacteriovorax marinus]ATH06388.1 hypothetical protein BIY24_00040 [Halobacteriovorax marinus]CBW24950.1 putative integral membrane protein [Halobacteriovorax marinus SJ]